MALLAATQGHGHRSIAARLGRPATTVRGWLRAARGQADALRELAWSRQGLLEPVSPRHGRLAVTTQLTRAVSIIDRGAAQRRPAVQMVIDVVRSAAAELGLGAVGR